MTDNGLRVPEGYFEESYAKTMQMVRKKRQRRKTVLASLAVILLIGGGLLSWSRASYRSAYEDYLAQQLEIVNLDVFMEIN